MGRIPHRRRVITLCLLLFFQTLLCAQETLYEKHVIVDVINNQRSGSGCTPIEPTDYVYVDNSLYIPISS